MKKLLLYISLLFQFIANAQIVGTPYIIPYPHPTSNGSAIVSGYTCSTASAGSMVTGLGVFGVSQTITALVTTVGTYNISTTSNGVTFSGTGTFTASGNQNIILTATGTPIAVGSNSFTLNTLPNCSFNRTTVDFLCGTSNVTFLYNGVLVTYGTVSSSGQCWLDRNIGATRVALSSTDANAYGDYFQWGRAADDHQFLTSNTTTTVSTTNTPGNANYIIATPDWIAPKNDNLWQGVNGINNVCPVGFRIPTIAELETERLSWSTNNSAGAFNSPLKLTVAGYRYLSQGWTNGNQMGRYWSSSVFSGGTTALSLEFKISTIDAASNKATRSTGRTVRCIKN
jgi:hypothetical protein